MSQQPTYRLQLLGRARLSAADGSVMSLSAKQLALLAYVALENDRAHDRQRVAELFWPDVSTGRERDNLRLALHKIRSVLGAEHAWLEVTRRQVRVIDTGSLVVDVHTLVDSGIVVDGGAGLAVADAAGLFDFVPDGLVDVESWWRGWSEHVRSAAVAGLAAAGQTALRNGQLRAVHGVADRLLDIDPVAEEGHDLHIRGFLAANQVTEAQRQLDRCDALLRDLLGIGAPDHLQDLLVHAARPTDPDDSSPPPAVVARDRPLAPLPLPTPTTPFSGRAAELGVLQERLRARESRLITLLGPGGIGKTRLSLEVAAREQHRFEEGAAFLRLDAINDAEAIPALVAQSLGLSGLTTAKDPLTTLCTALVDRELLLVADNVEHLVSGPGDRAGPPGELTPAEVFSTLTRRCPHVVVLLTSRVPLGARSEDVLTLGGLGLPPTAEESGTTAVADADSVRLLLERARRHDPRITVDGASRAAVVEICRLVDGMPLGLELAASAVRVLTLPEIAETLRTAPGTLPSSRHDGPSRHRDLGAVYGTAVATLGPEDRQLLQRLAVFVGGFSAEHAGEIAQADSDALARLVVAGLLDHQPDGRYRMHELIRQMATASRLAQTDTDEIADRHAERFIADLTDAAEALNRAGAGKVAAALDADRANILAAWSHAVHRAWGPLLLDASAGLTSWSLTSGVVPEHHAMVVAAAQLADEPLEQATWLLREIASLQTLEMPPGPTADLADRIMALAAGDPHFDELVASAELERGIALIEQESRLPEGRIAMQRAMEHAEGARPSLRAFVQLRLGYQALDVADFDTAHDRMSGALAIFEDVGHLRGAATARKGLAHVHDERWDLWPALQEVRAAEETFVALGNRTWTVYSQELRGNVLVRLGQYEEAQRLLDLVVQFFRTHAAETAAKFTLVSLGLAQIGLGHDEQGLHTVGTGISAMRAAGEANMLRFQLFDLVRQLRDCGRRFEAELDATELIRLNEQMESDVLVAAARVLRAHVRLPDGPSPEVAADLDAGWRVIRDGAINRLLDPLATLLECRDILLALDRDDEADQALRLGITRLRQVAAQITDADARRRFLTAVPACRTVLEASA